MWYFCCCLDRDILPVLHLFNFTYIFRFFEFFQSGFQGSVFVCENCIIFSLFGHGVRVNNILLKFQYIYISHVERLQWLCDILRTPFLQNIFGRLLPRITISFFLMYLVGNSYSVLCSASSVLLSLSILLQKHPYNSFCGKCSRFKT